MPMAAYEIERPSIALAQALQFELQLHQKVVIGEWLPIEMVADSPYEARGKRWQGGLVWDWVDDNFVLRRPGEPAIDLRQHAMSMEEIENFISRRGLDGPPRVGAMVISEWDHRPWSDAEFAPPIWQGCRRRSRTWIRDRNRRCTSVVWSHNNTAGRSPPHSLG
jgi:hypothetical protein